MDRIFLNGISTTHQLARELLSSDDKFLTVTIGEKEYKITNIKNVRTHANTDDSTVHKTLECNKEIYGNILR